MFFKVKLFCDDLTYFLRSWILDPGSESGSRRPPESESGSETLVLGWFDNLPVALVSYVDLLVCLVNHLGVVLLDLVVFLLPLLGRHFGRSSKEVLLSKQ